MKKKIIALCLVIALAATAVIGGTLAYFTDSKEAENTFTVGNVEIELREDNWDADKMVKTYPGQVLPKDPVVENTGNNPCYVRICIEWDETLGELDYLTDKVSGALGAGWTKGTDGYFYYEDALEKGEETTALFDSIVVPSELTNEDSGDYNVVVKAEAVQAQGKGATDTLAQWFTTCMG